MDYTFFVQGDNANQWYPSQRWQRNLFSKLENKEMFTKNGKHTYVGIKIHDTEPISYLNRPDIVSEINAVKECTPMSSVFTSWLLYPKTKKELFVNCGILTNLGTLTTRVFVGVPTGVDNGDFLRSRPHNGVLKMNQDKADQFVKQYTDTEPDTGASAAASAANSTSVSLDPPSVSESDTVVTVTKTSFNTPEKSTIPDEVRTGSNGGFPSEESLDGEWSTQDNPPTETPSTAPMNPPTDHAEEFGEVPSSDDSSDFVGRDVDSASQCLNKPQFPCVTANPYTVKVFPPDANNAFATFGSYYGNMV